MFFASMRNMLSTTPFQSYIPTCRDSYSLLQPVHLSNSITAFITIASSIIILYVHNVAIVLINIYLWFLVVREDVKIKKREDIYKKILENSVV